MTETTQPVESRPWIERYRPKNLREVSHQTEVVATLQNAVSTGRLPHLLLYGPPGSGKVRYSNPFDVHDTFDQILTINCRLP